MYKINEFSKMIGLNVKTLRYYDIIDLFKPIYRDDISGYRYYKDEQIDIIKEIISLKNIGLSLDEIKEYLKSHNQDLLEKKKKEYNTNINKIDEFNKTCNINYNINEYGFDKYIDINGLKAINNKMSEELESNKARYFVIDKNLSLL